jgi:hypothetical protein
MNKNSIRIIQMSVAIIDFVETQALLDFDVHTISTKSYEGNKLFTIQKAFIFCTRDKFVGFCRRLKKRVPLIYASNKYFLFTHFENENGLIPIYITRHIVQVCDDLEIPIKNAVYTSKLGSVEHKIQTLPEPEKIVVVIGIEEQELIHKMTTGQHVLPYIRSKTKLTICGEHVSNVFISAENYYGVHLDMSTFTFSYKTFRQQYEKVSGDLVRCWTEGTEGD